MTERKTIYLDDALEAIRKLPNAGIHWFVSAEAVFDVLLKLPSAQPEPCEDAVHAAYKHGKSKGIKKGLGMLKDAQPEQEGRKDDEQIRGFGL